MSFSFSPASRFLIGIPVALEMTPKMSFSVTASARRTLPAVSSSLGIFSSRSGIIEYLSLEAASQLPDLCASSRSLRALSRLRLASFASFSLFRSPSHCLTSLLRSSSTFEISFSACDNLDMEFLSFSFRSASTSMRSPMSRWSRSSMASGLDSCCIFNLLAASSTRSIAESGRRRSTRYLFAFLAAETRDRSVIRTPWCTSYFSFRPLRILIVSSTFGSAT
mmetsp:Transcript_28193/g.110756  ORF Transcript_28193/g.110756 Transcript_28193/m.110756 type:complete len:222 (+) Transcript_28193:1771-2436(+)